jgi:hypothetical protein
MTGARVKIRLGYHCGRTAAVMSEPQSGNYKGDLVVQVKLDGPEASIAFPMSALETLDHADKIA